MSDMPDVIWMHEELDIVMTVGAPAIGGHKYTKYLSASHVEQNYVPRELVDDLLNACVEVNWYAIKEDMRTHQSVKRWKEAAIKIRGKS